MLVLVLVLLVRARACSLVVALKLVPVDAQVEGEKMSADRAAALMLKGIYYNLPEMWISEQPFLLMTYLNTYMPWVARILFVKVIGPARIKSLREGTNVYDVKVSPRHVVVGVDLVTYTGGGAEIRAASIPYRYN